MVEGSFFNFYILIYIFLLLHNYINYFTNA